MHGKKEKDFNDVPRHYYSNFKTNLVRDAHYMAKAIVNSHSSHSPIRNGVLLNSAGAIGGQSVDNASLKKQHKIDIK